MKRSIPRSKRAGRSRTGVLARGVLLSGLCLLVTPSANAYHFFESTSGGCRWDALGAGNVDFLVDGSSTPEIGASLLAEVTTARDRWNDIATAQDVLGNFVQAPVDYDDTNFGTAWGIGTMNGAVDGQNEVVLDETGDILANVFGLAPANINGFGPSRREIAGGVCTISDAFNLLNGTRDNFDRDSTTTHEFGHIHGLAHSSVGQFNSRNNSAFSGGYGSPSSALRVINIASTPTMHPFSSGTGTNRRTPEPDDVAGLSELYPEPTFAVTLGGIQGTVTKCSDDSPLAGVNVRAVSRASPNLQVSRYTAFDGNGVGRYVISGLSPGDYDVVIEPMGLNNFTAGRMAIQTGVATGFPTEFYGPSDSEERDCSEMVPDTALPVGVTAGATTIDIDVKVLDVDLAFVVDDTGSMSAEISATRDILNDFVDTLEASALAFPTVEIVSFKDDVTLRRISDDPDELRAVIDSLFAAGGGDCAESSNAALIDAAKALRSRGVAILFTDADSRPDGPTRERVLDFFRSKSVSLNVLLSATCSEFFPSSAASSSAAAGSLGLDLLDAPAERGYGEAPQHRAQRAEEESGGAPPSGSGVDAASESFEEFDDPPTLGFEDAIETFSQLSTETGGIFSTTPRPTGGDALTRYVNTGVNLSISSMLPAVGLVTPSSGPQGATLDAEIRGANTNWGVLSEISFPGSTLVANTTEVLSPTLIVANVEVPADAVPGFVDVEVTTPLGGGTVETAMGVGAFQVVPSSPFPRIVSVTPSKGTVDQSLDVLISGIGTSFDDLSSVEFQSSFGVPDPEISVSSVDALSPTRLSVSVAISDAADLAFRDVVVRNGLETRATRGFLVTAAPPPIARIVEVDPMMGAQGDTGFLVTLLAENTSFVDGVSVAGFGPGVTVVDTLVVSSTEATAVVDIAGDAVPGFRDVQVSTGDETAVLLDAFLVTERSELTFEEKIAAVLEELRFEAGQKDVDKAIERLMKALEEFDDDEPAKKTFKELKKAKKKLEKAARKGADVEGVSQMLVDAVRAEAAAAIETAEAAGGKAKDIEKAREELAKGDEEAAKGKLDKACHKYGKAWEKARKAAG